MNAPSNTTTDQPTLAVQAHEWRKREVQAIGAAISTRSWPGVELAYNVLRDKMDRAGCWTAPNTRTNFEPRPAGDLREALESLRRWHRDSCYPDAQDFELEIGLASIQSAIATHSPAPMAGEGIPADILAHVVKLGRVEWGQTHAHDAEGHGAHVAESVRKTADAFDQTGEQHMHGLWLEGTETVLCHTGTSPNAPVTTQALVGMWNWLVDQAAAHPSTQEGGDRG